jgi:hypothetical protein
MKKEIFIAIFVGLSMGLIITFGVYRVKNSLSVTPNTDFIEEDVNSDATPTPTLLALHSPEDGSIQTEKELTVTGTTIPNAFVVLFVNDTDFISNSDESGNFSFNVELEDGVNIIRIHVLDENGTSSVEERLVVLSSAFDDLEAAQAELEAIEATKSADTNTDENVDAEVDSTTETTAN